MILNFSRLPIQPKRDIFLYITGCSGSGKSTYTRRVIEEMRQVKKNMPVYLCSSLPDDESLDSIKPKNHTS